MYVGFFTGIVVIVILYVRKFSQDKHFAASLVLENYNFFG